MRRSRVTNGGWGSTIWRTPQSKKWGRAPRANKSLRLCTEYPPDQRCDQDRRTMRCVHFSSFIRHG